MSTGSEFEGKIALVTGSSRGIGRAIALRLARGGAHVVINFFRNRAAAEETAEAVRQFGRAAYVVKAHVGAEAKIDELFKAVQEQAGGLDILVCNAASGFLRPALEQDARGWDWTLDINARSVLLCAQRAAPLMRARGGGHIVSISSLGGSRVLPNYVAVGVSKSAVETLTRYLAVELAPDKIAVNAVSGGLVDTDALKHFPSADQMRAAAARNPAGRMVEPDDLADVVAFLCSPAARMIRGQTIVVDGGYSLLM
jgi:enoyl-[acyl-carrier protein] reductase III